MPVIFHGIFKKFLSCLLKSIEDNIYANNYFNLIQRRHVIDIW